MANNTLIGALRVEASLDAGKFVDGAKKIQLQSKQTETVVKKSFGGLGDSVKAGIAGFVAAFSIAKIAGAIKSALDYAASLKTVAAQVGVTTKHLQEFRFAAGQVGVGQVDADKGLEQFNLNLSKAASGSDRAQKAFAAVGVSLQDIQTKSKPQIFGQIADQMIKQGGAAKNAAAANAIFGEGAAKLTPLLDQGSKGMSQLSEAAERLGIVLSDTQIQHADETAQKLDDLKNVLKAEFASTVTKNADSLYALAKALGTLSGEILTFLNSNPQGALALIGALAGGRFGVAGAAVGAAGGALLGDRMAKTAADSNLDIGFRTQQMRRAQQEYNTRLQAQRDSAGSLIRIRHGNGEGGTVATAKDEFVRQIGLLKQATAAALAKPARGNTPLPQFLARTPRTPHPRTSHPRSAQGPRDRSDDVEFQFQREQQQADLEILRAKQQLAGSSGERATIELKIITLEHDMQDAEINDRVRRAQRDAAEGKITQGALQQVEAQADILRQKNDEKAQLETQAFAEEQITRQAQAQFEAGDQQRRFALDNLHTADQLATTAADHRRIQLQILDAEMEQKRLQLEKNKLDAIRNGATKEEIANIQAQIDNLPQERANARAGVIQNTKSPLDQWAGTVPKTADEINEALQSIEVKGIDGLTDALTGVITGTESLKSAFHNLAASILADLIQMTIKMMLFKALQMALGGSFGGGGGSFNYGGGDALGSFASAPLPTFATGGFVSGSGTPTSDSIPAMLSNGEFVINAKSTKRFRPFLEKLNQGSLHLASGGLVVPRAPITQRMAANDTGGMSHSTVHQHFDLRGAVMTEDLMRQMNEKSQMAAQQGAQMGVERMIDMNRRTFGKVLK